MSFLNVCDCHFKDIIKKRKGGVDLHNHQVMTANIKSTTYRDSILNESLLKSMT